MPVLYVPKQAAKANSAGKKLFYPRIQLTGNVNTDQVAREIAQLSSLTSGDVKNVIDNLVTVVARHLQSSESVTLNGFGSFRYTLVKDSEGVETAEEVTPSQSKLMVRFTPASTRNTNGTVATRSLVSGARCVRFDQVTVAPGTGGSGTDGSDPDSGDGNEGSFG